MTHQTVPVMVLYIKMSLGTYSIYIYIYILYSNPESDLVELPTLIWLS
jgi:hypothetical protein